MPQTLKTWRWTDPVYDVDIYLLHGPAEKAEAWFQRMFNAGPEQIGDFRGAKTVFTVNSQRGDAVIFWYPEWFLRRDRSKRHPATIAHESLHGALNVLQDRGVEVNDGSDEAFAYYLTWLYHEQWKRLVG